LVKDEVLSIFLNISKNFLFKNHVFKIFFLILKYNHTKLLSKTEIDLSFLLGPVKMMSRASRAQNCIECALK